MRTLEELGDQMQEDISLYLSLFPNRCSEEQEDREKLVDDLRQIILNRTEEFKSFCLTDEQTYSNV